MDAKYRYDALSVSEDRYLIAIEDLETYRSISPYIYFQPPGIFDPSTPDGQNMKQLCNLFCSSRITADQFVDRLNELSWMLETEQQ